ncbi:hypothetical protein DZK27_15125 [Rhodobacteraceae bacterium 63075]|nr:hypothetical protein DZK27_15125 [Rhodobacteraceae bacterium 63075]
MRRALFAGMMLWVLAGCALDSEESLRRALGTRLYLLDTVHFASKGNCTAAVFTLAKGEFREPFPMVVSVKGALAKLRAGEAAYLHLEGRTPNEISEEIMSHDLPTGLGLISVGIGPAQDCMSDPVSRGYYMVLTSAQSQMVYLPEENALLLLYPPEKLAFFLRGNI